jgi:hypothetical protein
MANLPTVTGITPDLKKPTLSCQERLSIASRRSAE